MNKKLFCFLILFSFTFHLSGQRPDLKVKRISTQEGLSLNTVSCILKDSQGYIWFGTRDGLNRYNGYEFKIYKNILKDSTSLPYNDIIAICEDKLGRIWVGTNGGGLSRLDKEKELFTNYRENKDPESISNNSITDIYEDKKGVLWIGTYWGLNQYNDKTDKFKRFYTYDETYSLSSNQISKVIEDNNGNLWVGTKGEGLNIFDRKNLTCRRFKNDPNQKESLSNNAIRALLVDRKGRFWIATEHGLNLYNPSTSTFTKYNADLNNPFAISGNNILSLGDDEKGNLWIGMDYQGLNYFDVEANRFYNYWADHNESKSLSSNSIISILIDDQNVLWLGTNSGGVNKIDPNLPAFKHLKIPLNKVTVNAFCEVAEGKIWVGTDGEGIEIYNQELEKIQHIKASSLPESLNSDGIVCFFKDKSGNLWIGTYGGGVNYYDVKRQKFSHYTEGSKPENLSNGKVYSITEDNKGRIWMGTLGGGINVLDRQTGIITKYRHINGQESALSNDYISCVVSDYNGDIWVGTFGSGISRFDKKKNSFTTYTNDYSNVSNNLITCIFPDSKNNLWIGTMGNGLNYFNYKTKSIEPFHSVNSLPNNIVKSIQEDLEGNLWISTNNGLAKLNIQNKTFRNYDVLDGLQDSEFRERSSYRTRNGSLLFGGINGFNFFHPAKIIDNPNTPKVIISGFEIFNKPVEIGKENSPLKKDISQTKEIKLSSDESVFTLGFTGIHYTLTEKIKYAYLLEGFDKEWRLVGPERKATYTNLDPGSYTFKVKAANNDGKWNSDPTTLKIIVLPPFWKTWWFYLLASAIIFALMVLIFNLRTSVLRRQRRTLEKEVKKRTEDLKNSNYELTNQTRNLEKLYEENKVQGEKLSRLYDEITDSIKAAREIQQSILPSKEFINQYLPEHFILYKPKDVVSGDFYWFDVLENKIIIAAVDCTGHGVSGAFMSINGFHLINQAIYQHQNLVASEILDRVNISIKEAVAQKMSDEFNENGFDIGLCIIDKNNNCIEYAGAKHPMYLIRGKEVIQIKGNKFSIGATFFNNVNRVEKFTNHTIPLKEGDLIYLFSDGYPDQIGGDSETDKFLHTRFRELLVQIGNHDMDMQQKILENEFLRWQGRNEQLDDVLVVGFRV